MSKTRTAPNRFVRFLRNNLALIIIAVCLVAIISIVIIASVNANQQPALPVDGNVDEEPEDPQDPQDPADNPEDPQDPTQGDTPQPIVETFGLPVINYVLGMGYTDDGDNLFVYNSTLKGWQSHRAVDFLADAGTTVSAIKSGVVVEIGKSDSWGEYCIVDHGDGVRATYASLSSLAVTQGQNVAKGDKLGEVSDSALYEFKDGPHLHLAMSLNGNYVDPWDYIVVVGE